jgi:hypothetical protein
VYLFKSCGTFGPPWLPTSQNVGNPDEPSSVEAADRQNAKLVNWSLQQE